MKGREDQTSAENEHRNKNTFNPELEFSTFCRKARRLEFRL